MSNFYIIGGTFCSGPIGQPQKISMKSDKFEYYLSPGCMKIVIIT